MTAGAQKPLVLGLVGATASGKSGLAMKAANTFGGEIVCMDSMQIYRGLDIGTAKPTMEEQRQIPHHLVDIAEPAASYSVAQYKQDADQAIRGILSRGRVPILCGGTGLYLRALSQGLDFGSTASDEGIRAAYQQKADRDGREALHRLLQQRDPKTAQRLHQNDLRRVIRALEVIDLTGKPLSEQTPREEGPYRMTLFALSWERQTLYQRVERRAAQMVQGGLVQEVARLLAQGVPDTAQSMQGLGYKELIPVVRGEAALSDALALLMQRTRNYAKRQLTWFRADPRIHWLTGGEDPGHHLALIQQAMGETH